MGAFEGSQIGVGQSMSREVILLLEAHRAERTDELPLLTMSPPVGLHGTGLCEPFGADGTLVGLLAGVSAHVCAQGVVRGEATATHTALVRSLAGVDPTVLAEMLGPLEVLVADVADEAAVALVRHPVHVQRGGYFERLMACCALVRSQRGMRAHVTVEVTLFFEGSSAN